MSCDSVLLVEDDPLINETLTKILMAEGLEVVTATCGEEALQYISLDWCGVMISDIRMPGMDGLELMDKAREIDPNLPIILITAYANISMAVEAIKKGAYDFLEKPFSLDSILKKVNRALEDRWVQLRCKNCFQATLSEPEQNFENKIIGNCPSIVQLRKNLLHLSRINDDILIMGETGTGKELVARCLHENSTRRHERFVAINCGAIPENLIESELFGHEEGAFTGAVQRRIGKFEFANRGTVFLDEIESMPLHLQVRLLRVLQEKEIERVGSNEVIPLDFRVLAATKIDLELASQQGEFREDLFYRLNVFSVSLPPLRERLQDISLLFKFFIQKACKEQGADFPKIPEDLLGDLMSKKWSGNVRELANEARKFTLLSSLRTNDPSIIVSKENKLDSLGALSKQINEYERIIIERELVRQNGNIKETHLALEVPRQTLVDKIRKHRLDPSKFN